MTDIKSWPVKLSLFAMGIGAAGMLLIKPIIVGGLIDSFGYSPRQAGFVAGIEMAGVGLGTLIVVLFGGRWNGRWIAAGGALIGLLASIGPTCWSLFPLVLGFRLCAGIGCGVLVSVVIAAIAVSRDPDRCFSLYYMTSALAASLFFPFATLLVSKGGVRAAYFFVAVLLLPVFALLRQVPVVRDPSGAGATGPQSFPVGWAAVSLSASVLYWMGTGAVWAFIERIGVASGLSEARVGAILAASQITFVLGALAASLLHTRIGRALPAVTGVLLSLVALALIRFNEAGFGAGVLLYTFAWMFFFPYLTGIMAAQDASGRVAVLGVPSQTLGLAVGPAIAGSLIEGADFAPVLLLAAVLYGIAIVVLLPALLRKAVPLQAAEA
jgi:predicted MFS family arabinose efflux permease